MRSLLCLAFLAIAAHAAPLPAEDLGEPIRTMRRSGDFLITKPNGGWWFLTSYNPVARNYLPLQAIIVDLDTATATTTTLQPGGAFVHGWHNPGILAHDGTFWIGHYARVGLWRFDPRDGSLTYVGDRDSDLRVLPFVMQQAPN